MRRTLRESTNDSRVDSEVNSLIRLTNGSLQPGLYWIKENVPVLIAEHACIDLPASGMDIALGPVARLRWFQLGPGSTHEPPRPQPPSNYANWADHPRLAGLALFDAAVQR